MAEADHVTLLDAARQRGEDRFDRVRFRFIEALARRADVQDERIRSALGLKVEALLAAYRADMAGASEAPRDVPREAAARGPIAELVDRLALHAAPRLAAPEAGGPNRADPGELPSLAFFRSTWSRLSAERRLTQSLAKVPDNAGPLHSSHLVHRALSLMRAQSPQYLERFMTYVDALLWIEQLNAPAAPVEAPRAEKARKGGRGR